MTMSVSEVLSAVQGYGEPELALLLQGLAPHLSRAPVDALERLVQAVAAAAQAKSELSAMKGAAAVADAAVDAAEAEALAKAKP